MVRLVVFPSCDRDDCHFLECSPINSVLASLQRENKIQLSDHQYGKYMPVWALLFDMHLH
jgi:hypothetical protein